MNKTIFPLLIINQWMFNNKTNNKTAVEYTWRFVVEGAGGGGDYGFGVRVIFINCNKV